MRTRATFSTTLWSPDPESFSGLRKRKSHCAPEYAPRARSPIGQITHRHSLRLCLPLRSNASERLFAGACDEATTARARSIAFCSASATTGPTSRSASRRTTRVSSLRISTASAVEKDKSRSILALFSESAESPSVAKSNGHFSVPHNHRACTAATTRIAAALPRRVPSCADTLPHFFGFGLHFAASLRRAHGANPPRRSRDSRHPCPCHKPRG